MVNVFLGVFSVIMVFMIIAVIWLIYDRFKLKKEIDQLTEYVNRNNKDIAGLCSAAITIDTRLTDNTDQLKEFAQKVAEVQRVENTAQPYFSVIQKIRAGAGVQDLMQNSGLSRDEAVLLIRLHGNKKNTD